MTLSGLEHAKIYLGITLSNKFQRGQHVDNITKIGQQHPQLRET